MACCPRCRLTTIVVTYDIARQHLIIYTFVGLFRIIGPRPIHAEIIAMVDDNISYDASAFRLVGLNHRTQFSFSAK